MSNGCQFTPVYACISYVHDNAMIVHVTCKHRQQYAICCLARILVALPSNCPSIIRLADIMYCRMCSSVVSGSLGSERIRKTGASSGACHKAAEWCLYKINSILEILHRSDCFKLKEDIQSGVCALLQNIEELVWCMTYQAKSGCPRVISM